VIQPPVQIPPDMVEAFCKKWKIKEFSFFGSVLRDDFRPDSDIDVLVEFAADHPWSLYDVIDMEDELRSLLGREVDLVMKGSLRNPIRRREILRTRKVLYAA
jgi:uncharacterized protein